MPSKTAVLRQFVVPAFGTFVLAVTNVAMPVVFTWVNWKRIWVDTNPLSEVLLTLGWLFSSHIAASVLYAFLAWRLQSNGLASWIVFVNGLLAMGGTGLMEAAILYEGVPNLSGVWFVMAPLIQIVASLPSVVCLLFISFQKTRVS